MKYSYNDVEYYLECYDEIKREVDNFLYTPPEKSEGEKLNIIESKVGNKTEKELIKKFDDTWYIRRKHGLKCVDILFEEMDDRTHDIMKYRFFEGKSINEIAFLVNYERRTIHRKINFQKEKLYNLLKNVT